MNEHAGLDDEADSQDYLRNHPAEECALWQEWVLVVCQRRDLAPPNGLEWDALMRRWHHGKAPLTSVDELQALRKP